MKAIVRYHNKPHGVRIHNLHLVPVVKGVWRLHAELHGWEGQEIHSWGSDGHGDESVYFGDEESGQCQAQIKLIPGCDYEREPMLIDRLRKDTYEAVVLSKSVESSSWRRYLAKNFLNRKK